MTSDRRRGTGHLVFRPWNAEGAAKITQRIACGTVALRGRDGEAECLVEMHKAECEAKEQARHEAAE